MSTNRDAPIEAATANTTRIAKAAPVPRSPRRQRVSSSVNATCATEGGKLLALGSRGSTMDAVKLEHVAGYG